jgi:hypothetical protein
MLCGLEDFVVKMRFRLTLLVALDTLLVTDRRIIKGILLLELESVTRWLRSSARSSCASDNSLIVLGITHLSRHLCQGFESSPFSIGIIRIGRIVHLSLSVSSGRIGTVWDIIERQEGNPFLLHGHCDAFLDQMCLQAVNTPLGENLVACFACMDVSVTRIVQLGTSLEVFENQSYKKVSKVFLQQ